MRRSAREYDESDVRVRPNRRGSRPRTKDRPAHKDAVEAVVVAVDRGRWRTELVSDGTAVTAMRARELGRSPIVPGDRVALTGDVSGRDGSLARIVRIEERSSFLRRSADDDDTSERPLVANVDLVAIVTALADPPPRRGMIDRCLVAARSAGIDAMLVLTKADLADPAPFIAEEAPQGVDCVATWIERDESGAVVQVHGLDDLRAHLAGRTTVLIGHSGVGKSTLLNALVPGASRATGHVNDVTGRGRHTSSSALSLRLPGGGWVIDTPGVRSFGLGHIDAEDLLDGFEDLAPLADDCPRGCTHADDSPDCALDGAVEEGRAGGAGTARLASYRRLAEVLRRNDPWEA